MTIKQILVENKYFIVPFLIAILGGAFFMVTYSLTDGHILINQYHNKFFDSFFRYFTDLGDGIMFGVVILIALFIRFRIALYVAVVGVLTLFVISYISKELLFHDWPRPANIFGKLGVSLHYIDGVRNHMISTFPSGHSTTAFGLYTMIAFFTKNKVVKFLLVNIAILAAFSRVYLSQHFVRDTVVGSAVGFLIALFVFYYFNKKYKENSSLDKSLLNYKK
jgi:membrane-associated phospholipid phosphatase